MSKLLSEYEKSLTLAYQIEGLKAIIREMDMEHVKEMAERMIEQGDHQDAIAVLYPANPLSKNDLLRTMGAALGKLYQFVELLKKCDQGKIEVRKDEKAMRDIAKMFL